MDDQPLNDIEHNPEDVIPADDNAADLPEALPIDDDDTVDDVAVQLEELRVGVSFVHQAVEKWQDHFKTKLMYDQSKDTTVDALHRELTELREGQEFRHLRPMALDLLNLYDDLTALQNVPPGDAGEVFERLSGSLSTMAEDIDFILGKYGFELYRREDDIFDRKFQKAGEIIPTDDEALDGLIAGRLRQGLRYEVQGGQGPMYRVLRPELVQVYKLQAE